MFCKFWSLLVSFCWREIWIWKKCPLKLYFAIQEFEADMTMEQTWKKGSLVINELIIYHRACKAAPGFAWVCQRECSWLDQERLGAHLPSIHRQEVSSEGFERTFLPWLDIMNLVKPVSKVGSPVTEVSASTAESWQLHISKQILGSFWFSQTVIILNCQLFSIVKNMRYGFGGCSAITLFRYVTTIVDSLNSQVREICLIRPASIYRNIAISFTSSWERSHVLSAAIEGRINKKRVNKPPRPSPNPYLQCQWCNKASIPCNSIKAHSSTAVYCAVNCWETSIIEETGRVMVV